ncbi:hypothetical protein SpCBS45565_g07844 [Spizellomyces sp. 'palustris']|nr:hypothetical protein SpCBS45565_g07844 [Spizellomyces sp. 'palustris']
MIWRGIRAGPQGSFHQPRLGGWLWTVPLTTFCLGTWQLYRLDWKLDLIRKWEERMGRGGIPLPKTITPLDEYTRVTLTGQFTTPDIHLGPRTRTDVPPAQSNPVGYFVVSGFRNCDGRVVLVNRGWVPRGGHVQGVEGDVRIEGVVKRGEEGSIFMPVNRPDKNEWYWMDLKGMASYAGAEPILIELLKDSELNKGLEEPPFRRRSFTNFRNNHLQYAITWYGIMLFSSAVLWRGRRRAR